MTTTYGGGSSVKLTARRRPLTMPKLGQNLTKDASWKNQARRASRRSVNSWPPVPQKAVPACTRIRPSPNPLFKAWRRMSMSSANHSARVTSIQIKTPKFNYGDGSVPAMKCRCTNTVTACCLSGRMVSPSPSTCRRTMRAERRTESWPTRPRKRAGRCDIKQRRMCGRNNS